MNFLKSIYLLLLVSLVLLNDEFVKNVNGQLDAVSAVLSVVPVTSILATAGLVGVKLAALSRLLQALGYDRAYLANGGSGTAAQPIGLQKNYSYMFPYVPGLNISVKSEANSNYHNLANEQQQQQQESVTRKTFPSMGLPGDYENQKVPFRGSETLRKIFQDSGINIRFPVRQPLGGAPAKGNAENQLKIDPKSSSKDQSFNNQPFATTPMTFNPREHNESFGNNNVHNGLQLQPSPQLSPSQSQPQPPLPPPPPESSSGSLIDHPHSHINMPYSIHIDGRQTHPHQQPPSSSNSLTEHHQGQPQQPARSHPHHPQTHNTHTDNNRGQNFQVNMPHPHYKFLKPQLQPPHQPTPGLPSTHFAPEQPPYYHTDHPTSRPSSPSSSSPSSSYTSASASSSFSISASPSVSPSSSTTPFSPFSPFSPSSPSSSTSSSPSSSTTQTVPIYHNYPIFSFPLELFSNHVPIPQHEYYYRTIFGQQQADKVDNKPPQQPSTGHLTVISRVPLLKNFDDESPDAFEEYDRFLDQASRNNCNPPNNCILPKKPIDPAIGQTPSGPSTSTNNYNNSPTTSNFMSTPTTLNSDSPPFHDDFDQLDSISNSDHPRTLFSRRRRRKRDLESITNTSKAPEATISLGDKLLGAPSMGYQQQFNFGGYTPGSYEADLEKHENNFGMPALNIYPLRKRRSVLNEKILSSIRMFESN